MNTPRYDILDDSDVSALVAAVNDRIAQGWRPLGGVAYRPEVPAVNTSYPGGGSFRCAQPARYLQALEWHGVQPPPRG